MQMLIKKEYIMSKDNSLNLIPIGTLCISVKLETGKQINLTLDEAILFYNHQLHGLVQQIHNKKGFIHA